MTEKDIAKRAKTMLQNSVMHNINRLFTPSGKTKSLHTETSVKTRFNKGQLVRLSVSGPKHLYVQNYGFEGVKSNGINMYLEATNVVNSAIEQSNVVDFLAESISETRADEILIQFKG